MSGFMRLAIARWRRVATTRSLHGFYTTGVLQTLQAVKTVGAGLE